MRVKTMGRRLFVGLCAAVIGCAMCGSLAFAETAGTEETRMFTDSLGRTVEVPVNITKIAPSGHTAQQVLLTMAPELMVGLSAELTEGQAKYLGNQYADLPIFGAAFGAKGDLNKEAVAASGAQILIDTGEPKKGIGEDLDTLQTQMGIPCVFINTPLDGYEEAYKMLGDLLNKPERAADLGEWCTKAYEETTEVMEGIPEEERVNMAYLLGDAGLNAFAKGSYQSTLVDMCTNNIVEVEKASGSGFGNEVSLEQIALWNPDMIVFGPNSIYDTVKDDPAWAGITAIDDDNYYKVPASPWNWLNAPPTVNQVLGLQWLPRLCYPEAYTEDMMSTKDVVTGYYKLFYGYEMSDKEYDEMMVDALPR